MSAPCGPLVRIGCGGCGDIRSGGASAATLNISGYGELLGAFDVSVNGTLYDVEFRDGNYITLFSGCDEPSDFKEAVEAIISLFAKLFG